jgi:hypothetical protein
MEDERARTRRERVGRRKVQQEADRKCDRDTATGVLGGIASMEVFDFYYLRICSIPILFRIRRT